MEIIFGGVAFLGVIILIQLLRPKNLDQSVGTWNDDELARRLVNYERLRTTAGRHAMSGNLDSMTKCAEAGAKVKEINDEISRRRSLQTTNGYKRNSVTETGKVIDVATMAKADAGDANSQFLAGTAYMSGANGLPQDATKAIEYLRKAAESEHPHAAFVLGCAYADGIGVTQNLDYARNWAKKAQSLGVTKANDLLLAISENAARKQAASTNNL